MANIETISDDQASSKIDFYYIHNAYKHIGEVFMNWATQSSIDSETNTVNEELDRYVKMFKILLEGAKEEKSLQVIWYKVVGDNKKQHEVFSNLNSGKYTLPTQNL